MCRWFFKQCDITWFGGNKMKKKVGILIVIGIMLLGTTTLAGITTPSLENSEKEHGDVTALSLEFTEPIINEDDMYIMINGGHDMAFRRTPLRP